MTQARISQSEKQGNQKPTGEQSDSRVKGTIAIMMVVFFTCGFLTTLNDVLVPHLKPLFALSYFQVMFVQFSFFSAFFLFSIPSGKFAARFGFKRGLIAGLLTMSLGALLFVPAASVPSFALFMLALTVLATGDTCLQVSGNPYVLTLGPHRTSSSRLNLAQAFNSLGSTVAPYFGGWFIFRNAPVIAAKAERLAPSVLHAHRLHEAAAVKLPYCGIAACLALIALILACRSMPFSDGKETAAPASVIGLSRALSRQLILGAVGIFVYVGAEISIGSFLINYLGQKQIADLDIKHAAAYVSLYWGGAMAGRFGASGLLRRIQTGTVVWVSAATAFSLVAISAFSSGILAMWTIILVGLFNSVLFPGLFALGMEGSSAHAGKASGVLMAAAVGGAIVPLLQGALADKFGIHVSFLVPACCYLYVATFAGTIPKHSQHYC